jgi:hypothetical protein
MLDWFFRKKKKEDFQFDSYGRAGNIIYREGQKTCKIEFEISGVPEYHLLLYFDALTSWDTPEQIPITGEERQFIRTKLENWLIKKSLKVQF